MNSNSPRNIVLIGLFIFIISSFDLFILSDVAFDATLNGIIAVGGDQLAIEYNPSNDSIYLSYSEGLNGYIAAIDSSTNVLYAITKVGESPRALEYNPSNGYMYVVNSGSDSISVIDSSNNTVVSNIDVEDGPIGIEYNPFNEDIYITYAGSHFISVIDSSTNAVVDTISVDEVPLFLKYNPNNGDIYVVNSNFTEQPDPEPTTSFVTVIDSSTNAVVDTIEGINDAQDIEVNKNNGKIYVANGGTDSITIIYHLAYIF